MSVARRHLLIGAGAMVAGCSTVPYVPPLPPPEPLHLAVAGVDVVPAYSVDPPASDFILVRRQEQARQDVLSTLRSAIQAVGGDAFARVEIVAATFEERPLPPTGGVTGRLGLEPSRELWLRLAADIVLSDQTGSELARAGGEVTRSDPVLVGTSMEAVEQQARELTDETIRLLLVTLRESARERLAAWLA